jgi:hypothetical protein
MGILGSAAVRRVLAAVLYGVGPSDPVTIATFYSPSRLRRPVSQPAEQCAPIPWSRSAKSRTDVPYSQHNHSLGASLSSHERREALI